MALATDSTATNVRTIIELEGRNPALEGGSTMGRTTGPEDAQAPTWTITITEEGEPEARQYYGQLAVTQPASAGDNTSHYVAAGIYESNYTIDMDGYRETQSVSECLVPFAGTDRVYFYLTDAIASRNRAAEVEHCTDHRHAYASSLGTLNTALNHVAALRVGPFPTREEVTPQVHLEIRQRLLPPMRGVALTPEAFMAEYDRLSNLSGQRDRLRYHTWGMQLLTARPAGVISYLTGAARDAASVTARYVQLTNGGTRVGDITTASLIV